jgi:HEAT repeat protein
MKAEPSPPIVPNRRIWRRTPIIIAANAALILAGLAAILWFDCRRTDRVAVAFAADDPPDSAYHIGRLGGREWALRHLRLYLAVPGWLAPHRAEAVALLGSCGPAARERLVALLSDPEAGVRAAAASGLGLLGQGAAEAQGALIRLLSDSDAKVRTEAALALGLAGAPFGPAVEPLVLALEVDPEGEVRAAAAESLGRIGPLEPTVAEAVKALARGLADREWRVCHASAEALGRYESAARAALPELVRALDSRPKGRSERLDALARCAAIDALGRLGPAAAEAAPALTRLLADQKPVVRCAAAEALGRIGPAAAPAQAALELALKDDSGDVRTAAAEALKSIRGK